MRQVLLRIRLDDLWSIEPIDGVTAVGAGYAFLLLAAVYVAARWWERSRAAARHEAAANRETAQNHSASRVVGILAAIVVAAALLTAPRWAAPLAPHGIPIFGYGAMVFLGFVFGGWTAMRLARRSGIEPDAIWDLITWVFIAGIGGARIFYLVQKHEVVFAGVSEPREALMKAVNLTDGGLVLLGGVLAVVAAILLFCRRRGIPPLRMGDVLVPSFFVGLGFGRIGCLMNGCCFGDRCDLPWAIHFPPNSAAWGLLVTRGFLGPEAATTYGLHPTQIYSSIAAFLLAAVTAAYFRWRPFEGAVLAVGMILYALKRFVIEFLRGDELGQFGTMFTVSQWISAGIFVGGLILLAWLTHGQEKGIRNPAFAANRGRAPAGRG